MNPGDMVSHYQIKARLGQGGMGVVYRAVDQDLGRTVALKFLPAELSQDAEANARFVREARAASALDHSNICTIHEIATTDAGELYIVMAYYEGRTLDELLEPGPCEISQAIGIAHQLSLALERAHEAGIVHRDLKPANVMVTDRGEVKLLDFGIAKLASSGTLTKSGTIMGTFGYLSPEQIEGAEVDARADIWALGVILYQMLSGRLPFDGDSEPAILYSIMSKSPVPLVELRPDLPPALTRLVLRCLEKDPVDRPADATTVANALAAMITPHAVPDVPSPTRRAIPRSALALAVVALLVATALLTRRAGIERIAATPPPATDALAVLPFEVQGSPDMAYLSEGLVDLLSTKLEGVGGLRVSDPRAVLAVSGPGSDAPGDLARELGASRYITGNLVEAGGRIRLTADLRGANRDSAITRASVEGGVDQLFELIDQLVAELLVSQLASQRGGPPTMASATTKSLDAAKEYLRGEKLLRGGQYRAAASAYEAALGFDSTFALAYYRKSLASDWTDAYDVRSTADKALEYSSGLPPRVRSLLEALKLQRNGRYDDAEREYRAHLHQYPDEVEALVQLGEVLFHANPRRGRSIYQAIVPLKRAVEYEPANMIAQIHLARLYAALDSADVLRATAALMMEVASGSERALEIEALYAYTTGSDVDRGRVLEQLRNEPWFYRWYAVHGLVRFTSNIAGAEQLLADRTSDEPLLLSYEGIMLLNQGRVDRFREFLEDNHDKRSPAWDLYLAAAALSPTFPATESELQGILTRLRTASPRAILGSSWIPPYEDLTERLMAFTRDYYVAQLLLLLGRTEDATAVIDAMATADAFTGVGSAQEDLVLGLRAELALRQGEREKALDLLRQVRYEVPHAANVRPALDGARTRWLRAELERELGDVELAQGYYEGLAQSWSPWDAFYQPFTLLRLAELALEAGNGDEALRHYRSLLALWHDTEDPAVQPELQLARHRSDSLAAAGVR